MKLTKVKVEYIDKKTNEKKSTYNYKLWLNDEVYVMIRAVFKDDTNTLKVFAIKE